MTDPTADAAKLLPCPFCGATLHQVDWHKTLLSGYKLGCYLTGRPLFTTDDPIAWNTRPQPAPPAGEPERDHKLLARQISNIAAAYRAANPTGELSDDLIQVADEINRLGLAARPKVEDAEVADIVLLMREKIETLEADLRTKETQLAQADAVISEYVRDDVIFDAEKEPKLKSFDNQREAQRRHAARQQQKASDEQTERDGE